MEIKIKNQNFPRFSPVLGLSSRLPNKINSQKLHIGIRVPPTWSVIKIYFFFLWLPTMGRWHSIFYKFATLSPASRSATFTASSVERPTIIG